MSYLVPFDGSPLSEAALAKARLYAIALDEAPAELKGSILRERPLEVTVVSVVPDSAYYAREKGWVSEGEEFSTRRVVERLHEQVTDVDPSAEFQFERVGGSARAGAISKRIRGKAEELGVDVVFMGSENAGRIVTPITSVSASVAADRDYDLHIVRRRLPPEQQSRLRSEFFFTE